MPLFVRIRCEHRAFACVPWSVDLTWLNWSGSSSQDFIITPIPVVFHQIDRHNNRSEDPIWKRRLRLRCQNPSLRPLHYAYFLTQAAHFRPVFFSSDVSTFAIMRNNPTTTLKFWTIDIKLIKAYPKGSVRLCACPRSMTWKFRLYLWVGTSHNEILNYNWPPCRTGVNVKCE